jgi:hypothetical protein
MAWRLLIEAGLNLILGGLLVWLASRRSVPPPALLPLPQAPVEGTRS